MKGNFPKPVYYFITILAIVILTLNSVMDLPIAATAVGAGLFAYGLNRLIGEWRIERDPEYAKKIEIFNRDERLAYIADKSRSTTLIVTVLILAILGIVLLSFGLKPYGYTCLYTMCGISLLHYIIYQILSRRY